MPKNKPNKGLLKRIRITKSGRVKSKPAFSGHLRSHKSGETMRSYRKAKYAHAIGCQAVLQPCCTAALWLVTRHRQLRPSPQRTEYDTHDLMSGEAVG